MKRNLKLSVLLIIVLVGISSCTVQNVRYSGNKVNDPQTIALVSTMIGKYSLMRMPLIDAAIIDRKTKGISDQIMDRQSQIIDQYRESIASELKKSFNCDILYGESLHNADGYTAVKEDLSYSDKLVLKSDHFPVIITASDDVNPFNFSDGDIKNFFYDPALYKYPIYKIAKDLNADITVVSHSYLSTYGSGYGIYDVRLYTYLYFFNRLGDKVAVVQTSSDPIRMDGKDIEDYQKALDSFQSVVQPLIREVANTIQ